MSTEPLPPTVGLVLHFRHHAHTAACLDSLRADGIGRVVLVDNSEDGGASLARLRPYLDTLQTRGMNVVVHQPGRNLGFSAGVNAGLKEIALRFGTACVMLINNDARLVAGSHALLRRTLSGGVAAAVAEMRTPRGGSIRSAFYHRPTGLLMRKYLPGAYPYHSGCCLLIAPALASPPLFDEDFFFYGDDTELGWRLARQGMAVRLAEGAVVEHEVSAGSRNGSLFYEYHMARAHWLLARKVAETRLQYGLFLLGRTLMLPARALLRTVRQRSAAPLRGLALAIVDVIRGRCRALTPPPPEPAATAADDRATSPPPPPPSSPR